ncbi:MAG: hypothetical protein O8C61_01755 [Candidatus Methanoperedens sp.]|nr:hypothetical protein [Candidatus Methanoperedens sp.]
MSILDVTEDQIFQTLGKGKDPNFKQIEKARPVTIKPKKTYTINSNARNINSRTMPVVKPVPPVEAPVQQVVITAPHDDESVKKLKEDVTELNNRIAGLQKMVKWYIVPQFIVVLVLVLAIALKS